MNDEEKQSLFQRYDKLIVRSLIIVVPILFAIGLYAIELENRVDDVNSSRAELTYIGCLEQNERNVDAKIAVKALFQQSVAKGQQTQGEADTAVKATEVIIEALAPHRDCQALVLDRFGFVPEGIDSTSEDA